MRALDLPPLIRDHAVFDGNDPLEAASRAAAMGEAGAGDLFYLPDMDTARWAIVLEPDVAMEESLAMIPLAMVAMADCLGAIGQPNLAITHAWPNLLHANGARVGHFRMRFAEGSLPGEVPSHAVLGIDLAIARRDMPHFEPGRFAGQTVLHEEGCGDIDAADVLESWSRHFMTWIDTWEKDGFRQVHENWLFRAHDREKPVEIRIGGETRNGIMAGLDEHGGLLLRGEAGMTLVPLADALKELGGGGE